MTELRMVARETWHIWGECKRFFRKGAIKKIFLARPF